MSIKINFGQNSLRLGSSMTEPCSSHTDPSSKQSHGGKLTEFPINGTRINEPGSDPDKWETELLSEDPLLLNPYLDDPEDHIDFDEFGIPFSKSARGKATIDICDLGRSSLVEKRLNLKGDTLLGMMNRLLCGDDMDTVNPPNSELSLWRKSMIQHRLLELCSKNGIVATRP